MVSILFVQDTGNCKLYREPARARARFMNVGRAVAVSRDFLRQRPADISDG